MASSSSSSGPHVIPMDDTAALVSLPDGNLMRSPCDENRTIRGRIISLPSNKQRARCHSAATPPTRIPPRSVAMDDPNKRRKMNHRKEDRHLRETHRTVPTVLQNATSRIDAKRIEQTLHCCQSRLNQMLGRYLLQEAARGKDRVLQLWQQRQQMKNQRHHPHPPFFSSSINQESTTLSPWPRTSPQVYHDFNPTANPTFTCSYGTNPSHRFTVNSVDDSNNNKSFASKTTTLRILNEDDKPQQERTRILQQAYRLKRISTLLQQYNHIHIQLRAEMNQSIIQQMMCNK
jgi:hypothetical protein